MLYIPLFDLVQARPWFRSSIWISSVAGISKMLCASAAAGATLMDVRMLGILRHTCVEARDQNRSKSSFPRIGRDAMIG